MSLSKLREIVKDKEAWCAVVHGITKIWTRFSDWRTTTQNPLNSEWVKDDFLEKTEVFLLVLPKKKTEWTLDWTAICYLVIGQPKDSLCVDVSKAQQSSVFWFENSLTQPWFWSTTPWIQAKDSRNKGRLLSSPIDKPHRHASATYCLGSSHCGFQGSY